MLDMIVDDSDSEVVTYTVVYGSVELRTCIHKRLSRVWK